MRPDVEPLPERVLKAGPPATPADQIRARQARGRRAESAAADYLFARGFEILFANLRVGRLELDLVARQGPLVVVVEVRTRGPGSLTSAFESIGPLKRARLLRATERLWREKLAGMAGVERVRIDVAAVRFEGGETSIEIAEGAIIGG